MSRLWKIAVREYLAYVRTIGFWLSMATVPLILLVSVGAPILMARSTPPPTVTVVMTSPSAAQARPELLQAVVAALGRSGAIVVSAPEGLAAAGTPAGQRTVLAPYLAGDRAGLRVLPSASPDEVRDGQARPPAGVRIDRPLDFAVLLTTSSTGSGTPTVRIWSRVIGSNAVRRTVDAAVHDWTRSERLRALGVLSDEQQTALMNVEPRVESYSTRAEQGGQISQRDLMPGYIGLAMGLALWSAAMTGAGILLNSVIEEKSSRILEVLLSSASVPQIMGGKILGVAGVTATVLGMWGVISSVVLATQQPQLAQIVLEVLLSRGLLFYFLFYFLAGYIMYATLFVTVGAFCETSREAQTLLGPMMIVLIVPMLFLTQAITQPDSPMLRGLSWFPLFAPFLMAARAANEPPVWEILGTGAILIATIAGEVWIAGRAFKAGALSTSRFDIRYFFASLMGRGAT